MTPGEARPRLCRRLARLGAAALAVTALGFGCWRGYRAAAGEPSARLEEAWHEGHRVLDREGRLLRELPSEAGLRGRSVPLAAMGERVALATITSEDKSFYAHDGVSPKAIARAVSQGVRHARVVSGASTITQQLVKLLDSGGEPQRRGLVEKLREAARAQNLERAMTKDEILEAYLNRLSYGHGLVGPEAAAQGYFGVAARDLSWAQAAFLAVLPRAPSYLDPHVHLDRVRLRQAALLDALLAEGLLPEADHARAKAEPIALRPFKRPFLAPHFVESLRAEGKLMDGAVTRTTLDVELQGDVEGLVRTHLASVAAEGATDAAVLVADNATGEVLAYVGSADFHDVEIAGQVDMARALRQPGSTLKPFVYALAFERGHDGAEMLADVPTSFAEDGRGVYAPGNFHGTFEGPISAREALAGSLNVPVVRLAADLPPGALLESLHRLGFTSLDREASHYGLALALGSGEVRLRELGAAYVALARGGEAIGLRMRPDEPARPAERVMDAGVAAMVTEILSDPLARVRGLHGQGPFDIGFPVAVKTGTSSGFRDTWSAGYTRERTVAVWVGNADGSPMRGLTGASGAGPLFADVMRRAMRDVPQRAPLWDGDLLVAAEVCPLSGKPAGPSCPEHATRWFARGHAPEGACGVHVKAAPRSALPSEAPWRCVAGDTAGAQTLAVFPEAFEGWLGGLSPGAPGRDAFGIPWYARSAVPGCGEPTSGRAADLRVDSPAPGSVFLLSSQGGSPGRSRIELAASFSGGDAGARPRVVDFVVDGVVAARSGWPYRAHIEAQAGDHEVLALPSDPGFPVHAQASRFSVR